LEIKSPTGNPIGIRKVNIGTAFEEELARLPLVCLEGLKDGCFAVAVLVIRVGSVLKKYLNKLNVLLNVGASMVQSCIADDVLDIRWSAMCKKIFKGLSVARSWALGGLDTLRPCNNENTVRELVVGLSAQQVGCASTFDFLDIDGYRPIGIVVRF
jgi:hypothetical protein